MPPLESVDHEPWLWNRSSWVLQLRCYPWWQTQSIWTWLAWRLSWSACWRWGTVSLPPLCMGRFCNVELQCPNRAPRATIWGATGFLRSGRTMCMREKSKVWFFAKKPALRRRWTASLPQRMWFSATERAWISDTLRPHAAATRKVVFLVRSIKLAWWSGSNGGSARRRRALGRSQAGTRDMDGGRWWNMPLVKSWMTGEFDTVLPSPKPWCTAATVVLQDLTEYAVAPSSLKTAVRKSHTCPREAECGLTAVLLHPLEYFLMRVL